MRFHVFLHAESLPKVKPYRSSDLFLSIEPSIKSCGYVVAGQDNKKCIIYLHCNQTLTGN